MADRSPNKPRRSLTPDAMTAHPPSQPPPLPTSGSGGSSRDEADDIDDSDGEDHAAADETGAGDASAATTKSAGLEQGDRMHKLQPQQPSTPHPSPGGATPSSSAEDLTLQQDRSPSKPKRVTSPLQGPLMGPPQPPPFPRRTGSSLGFSLREDPEPPHCYGKPMMSSSIESSMTTTAEEPPPLAASSSLAGDQSFRFPLSRQQQQQQQQQQESSLPFGHCSGASIASSLLPPQQQQQQQPQQQPRSQSPPPPLHYSTYAAQWDMSLSSSLHHPTQWNPRHHHRHATMDDESTQTWNNNESTQTFAPSSAWFDDSAPALFSGTGSALGGGMGDRERAYSDDDHSDQGEEEYERHADDAIHPEADPDDGATAAAGAASAAEGPTTTSTFGTNSGTTSKSSPGSSNDQSPTSASMSITSLTGTPHPAPASTTSPPDDDRRRQRRRRRRVDSTGDTFRPVLTMEVAPGLSRPLWHSDLTRDAVQHGRANECECMGCRTALYYVPHAAYVLCPVCSTVGPLSLTEAVSAASPSALDAPEDERSNESAICVGVKRN